MNNQVKFANIAVFETVAKLDEAIKSVATKGKTLDALIHRTGVSCMYHAREHGDTRKMVALIQAMPKSGRRKALIVWIEAHMPCEVTDNKNGTSIELVKGRKPEDFALVEAASTPFWDFTVERAPVAMTLERAVALFEKSLEKAVKEGYVSEAAVAAIEASVKSVIAANDAANDAADDAAEQAAA